MILDRKEIYLIVVGAFLFFTLFTIHMLILPGDALDINI
jgi:hypothetical protein